jgi:hypothetical protein
VRIVLTRTLDAGDERALEVGTSHGGEAPSRSTPRPPTQPAGHPPMTTAATSAADLAGPRIRGIIQLPAGQTSKNGTGTLFLTVRSTDSGRGMPTAAVKVDNPVFPYHFDLGTENIPLNVDNKADMLQGQLYLNGSLDGDGNAFSKLAGDLYFDPVPVRAGADELTISLDQEREPQ